MWDVLRNFARAIRNDSTEDSGALDGTEYVPVILGSGRPVLKKALATRFPLLVGDQTIAGIKTFSSMFRIPVNDDVAAAGSDQDGAAEIATGFTVVTGANDTKGVKLDADEAVAGSVWLIKVGDGADLKVYPPSGGTINALQQDAAITVVDDVCFAIVAKSATQFYTLPLLPS